MLAFLGSLFILLQLHLEMKSISNGQKLLLDLKCSSFTRRKSTTSPWSLPELLQKLKIPSLLPDIFTTKHDDFDDFDEDDMIEEVKEPKLSYKYTSSGKTVASIQNRARTLLNSLKKSETDEARLRRLGRLIEHMKKYPVTRSLLKREGGVSSLLYIREETKDDKLKMSVRAALTILGFADPVKEAGIRILSLDGGGTRY